MSYASKEKALAARIAEAGILHFTAAEVLTLGGSHFTRSSAGHGLNTAPPDELLGNIIPALTALDQARQILGRPVGINSTYRSNRYNRAIGGAKGSKHLTFHAIDCFTYDPSLLDNLYRLLAASRDQGTWTGGLGGYNTFVHLDCGSAHNRTWGKQY
jgi:hypothetical protein